MFRFVITLIFLSCTVYLSQCAEPTDYARLRKNLIFDSHYDKNARPVQSHVNVTLVRFHVLLRGFEYEERRHVFTLYGWTVMRWKDENLKWTPRDYANISKIHFAKSELWLPDLSVYNNLDQTNVDHFGDTRILAFSSGMLVWVAPTKFQVGCENNLRKWPYDMVNCQFVIGSWAHDGSSLDIELPVNMTRLPLIDYIQNREWDLLFTHIGKRTSYYGNQPDVPYPDMLITIGIKRNSASHNAGYVVPGIMITVTILVSFWMSPSSFERMALILIDLLINALYLNYIYLDIPNNGSDVPLLLLFFRDTMIMNTVALIWTMVLKYLAASKRTSPVPLPGLLQGFLEGIPGKILCLDPRPTRDQPRSNGENDDGNKLVSGGRNPFAEDWAWLAHLLDRVGFVIYLIIYICFVLGLLV